MLSFVPKSQGRQECRQAGSQEAEVLGVGHLSFVSLDGQSEGEFQEPGDMQTY